MKKFLMLCIVLVFCIVNVFADSVLTIKIENVTVNGGNINVSIFLSEQSYKKQIADMNITIDSSNETLQHEITLPAGEYLVSTHQDVNGNGDMDYGLFKIPKEPYGFSKMKGKIPGNFNAMKIIMNGENEEIIIPFVEY